MLTCYYVSASRLYPSLCYIVVIASLVWAVHPRDTEQYPLDRDLPRACPPHARRGDFKSDPSHTNSINRGYSTRQRCSRNWSRRNYHRLSLLNVSTKGLHADSRPPTIKPFRSVAEALACIEFVWRQCTRYHSLSPHDKSTGVLKQNRQIVFHDILYR